MEKLYKGIHRFQSSFFKKEEEFFGRLSDGQKPEVMFITCADSRIDPALVTQSRPGELFIVRNVGNIIPPYDALKDKNSVAAAIEFTVLGLKVKDIIICGHSDCGAMQALYRDEGGLDDMPHLKEWLSLAFPVKEMVSRFYPDSSTISCQQIAERENILLQLKNLQTYPFVDKALKEGEVYLHGWYYDIGSGNILTYNPETDIFEKIIYEEGKERGKAIMKRP